MQGNKMVNSFRKGTETLNNSNRLSFDKYKDRLNLKCSECNDYKYKKNSLNPKHKMCQSMPTQTSQSYKL